ncbi:MAG TPA: hypothetical protein VLC09_12335, partial [Polyangiaceae bacterium]|nr:hypothetical protein [Polyangiaceae bacterium]
MKLLLVGHGARRFAALGAALILGVGSLATTACSEDAPADDVGGGGSIATGGSTGHTGGSASGGDGGGGGGGGQGGEPGTGGGPVAFIEKDIEDLAVTSAASYADNAYGVISGSTLAAYQADWAANKPAGVEGRLVILQVTPAGVNSSVLAARDNEHGVYSYLLPAARVAQARSNGLSAFETDIPDGPTADGVLKSFDIDPTKDFLVLTFEHQAATTNAVVQSVGRAWVFFNYWGWPKERLAILNGSVNWNASAGLQTTLVAEEDFNLPTNTGTKSFRDLHVDQTVASISLEELLAILK